MFKAGNIFVNVLKCFTAALLLFVFLPGCVAPLVVDYKTASGAAAFRLDVPARVFVEEYRDARNAESPEYLGSIEATVSGINSNKLVLDRRVSELVTGAFGSELSLSGLIVVTEKSEADFILSGEIRRFNLDIGARDKISIEIYSEMKETSSGKTVLSSSEKEEHERFAGVMGNTKKTVEKYVAESLAKVTKRALEKSTLPGRALGASPVDAAPRQVDLTHAVGAISVVTVPSRAKVYIDGVYYGFSPITVDIAPGIYTVRLKLSGFKEESERVSVRKGHTTEIETTFTK